MGFIKKIIAHPLVKMFLSYTVLKYIILGLLVAGTFFIIFKWIKKKKNAKGAQPKPKKKKKINSSYLLKIWKKFISQIPLKFRSPILYYKPAVILGESGSGKTLFIDNYTDWKGQANQFYPSYTDDPLVKLYLGSQIVAQEISSTLLNDTSSNARVALTKLWKQCFCKREPIVYVILKADIFKEITPDALKRQAQLIRGKINLIASLQRKPVQVRIVMTHAEVIEGFFSFSKFLEQNEIELKIDLQNMDLEKNLEYCLESYEEYIPLALTTMDAGDYKNIISFFNQAPQILQLVSIFLQTLTEKDLWNHELNLDELYFISNISKEKVCNPFIATWTRKAFSAVQSNVLKHKIASFAAGIIIAAYFLFSYFYEFNMWQKTEKLISKFSAGPSYNLYKDVEEEINKLIEIKDFSFLRAFYPAFYKYYDKVVEDNFASAIRNFYLRKWRKAKKIIEEFEKRPSQNLYEQSTKRLNELDLFIKEEFRHFLKHNHVNHLLPKVFVQRYENETKASFVNGIRKFYFFPLLIRYKNEKETNEKVLYLVALIYSSKNNEIGKLVKKNIDKWCKILDVPKGIIHNYIKYSNKTWDKNIAHLPLKTEDIKNFADHSEALKPNNSPDLWINFFLQIKEAMEQNWITPTYLEKLRSDGKILKETIDKIKRYEFANILFSKLKEKIPVDLEGIYAPLEMAGWISKNQKNLRDLFVLLYSNDITIPLNNSTLHQFVYNVQAAGLLKKQKFGHLKNLQLQIKGKRFVFSIQKWMELIRNSKISLLIDDFVYKNQLTKDRLLFSGRYKFKDIVLNEYNEGNGFILGKYRIKGYYTQKAYKREIRPTLDRFVQILDKLPKELNERKKYITNFIAQKMEKYASNYFYVYENYYQSFGVKASSGLGLTIILKQMRLPASPFQDFLEVLADNTHLEEKQGNKKISKLVAPLHQLLKEFKPINKLIIDKQNPSLQTYQEILLKLQNDIGYAPAEEKEKEDNDTVKTVEFVNLLSSLGKISFPIFQGNKNSYLTDIKTWLNSVEILGKWQKPFLAPIYCLHDLGIKNIENTVANNWNDRVLIHVKQLFVKFPLNPKGLKPVLPSEIDKKLHPVAGTFWNNFRIFIKPVCIKQNGKWFKRTSPLKNIKLPDNMLAIVNHLNLVTNELLDHDGNYKPFKIEIKTKPLPFHQYYQDVEVPTLGYLNIGDNTIFNLNQRSSWKTVEIKWWKQTTSQVVIKLSKANDSKEIDKSIVINETLWSFLRLLQKARQLEKDGWTWVFPENASDYTLSKITFYIKNNPLSTFTTPYNGD